MRRRSLLKLGLASAAVLAAAGGTLTLWRPGWSDAQLSPGARALFAAVSRAVLDGTLPTEPSENARAIDALLSRIESLVAGLPPHAQSELSQLLAVLDTAPGRRALAGLSPPWPEASVVQLQAALQSMRLSSLPLRQQAYQALHDIVGGAYFSEPATWAVLGYPGPLAV
jgi:hypothetical protein